MDNITEDHPFFEENGYIMPRYIEGRGWCALHKLLFTTGIVYGIDLYIYQGRYCYESPVIATIAFMQWDGKGDPDGDWIVNKGERGGDRYNPNRHDKNRPES